MRQELLVIGVLLCGMTYLTAELIETCQLIELNDQGRELTRTVRLRYPRIPAGDCPLWDRIRNGECEEEYRD